MIEKNTCSLNFCYISTNSVSRTRLAAMSRRNIRPPFVTKSKTRHKANGLYMSKTHHKANGRHKSRTSHKAKTNVTKPRLLFTRPRLVTWPKLVARKMFATWPMLVTKPGLVTSTRLLTKNKSRRVAMARYTANAC